MSHSQYPFHQEGLGLMLRIKVTLCLLVTFFVSFIVTTIMTDYFAWKVGFYEQGISDSRCVETGECDDN